MKKNSYFLFIVLLFLVISCKKSDKIPLDKNLTGKWVEHLPDGTAFFEATLHTFRFTTDSFFAKIISWTDIVIIIPNEPCPKTGYEEMFIKGSYTTLNDSIYFSGKLCDSLYQNLKPTCEGKSNYKTTFQYIKNDTALIFNADKYFSFGYGIVLKKEE